MNDQQKRAYQRERAAGWGAKVAHDIAKFESKPPQYDLLENLEFWRPAEGEIDGLTVTVSVEDDNDSRLGEDDVTGTFHDGDQQDGWIKNTTHVEAKWYKPSNYDQQYAESEVRATGCSRGRVQELVRERIKRAMKDDANRVYYGVIATVSFDGTELASDSLWGIDTIGGDPQSIGYLRECAADCISNALHQAHEQLPRVIAQLEQKAADLRKLLAPRDRVLVKDGKRSEPLTEAEAAEAMKMGEALGFTVEQQEERR